MRTALTAIRQKINPELRKILGNISWLFAERFLRMGVGFLVGAWVARYLGPQQFGTYNYAIAFVSLFSTLATLGLDQIVVRNLVREPTQKNEILGTTFILKLIGGITTVILATGTIVLLRPSDILMQWLVGITAAILVFQSLDGIKFWFQSQVQSKYTVLAQNTAFILIALVKIVLIQMQAPLIAFAWAALIEIALGSVGLAIAYQWSGQSLLAWRGSWLQAKRLLKDSWPLIVAGLSIMIYIGIDKIMLGQLADSEAVGIYAVATRLSELWVFIPAAIVSSFSPSIIEAKGVSEARYYQKLQKLFNIMTGLAYCVAIPMTFLSTQVVTIIYGQEYASSGAVLAIHIWGQVFSFLGIAKRIWVVTEELTVYDLVITSGGALLNIGLNFWLIPLYREIGSAIATVISYMFVDYIIFLLYPPIRRLAPLMTNALFLKHVFVAARRFWN